jgi:hypothetical protein
MDAIHLIQVSENHLFCNMLENHMVFHFIKGFFSQSRFSSAIFLSRYVGIDMLKLDNLE